MWAVLLILHNKDSMIPKETLKLSGILTIILIDSSGNIKDIRKINNLIVNTGLDFITSRMAGTTKGVMSHMAIGSNAVSVQPTQTDIQTILGSRVALIVNGGTPLSASINYACEFNIGVSTGTVTEAAIFNSGTAATGDMLCRTVFTAFNKSATDSMIVNWNINLVAV